MNPITGSAIGAGIAGVVGAAVWAGIAYAFHIEIGWIAWGIGALVGLGAAVGAAGNADTRTGTLAAVIAVASIVGGKYAAVEFSLNHAVTEIAGKVSTQDAINQITDEILKENADAGKKLKWPAGKDSDNWENSADLPPGIWDQACKRWADAGESDKQARLDGLRQQRAALVGAIAGSMKKDSFLKSFSLFDIIFGFLAIATAFKIGSGTGEA